VVLDVLRTDPGSGVPALGDGDPAGLDPYGEDLQLALLVCYELHYRGFAGVAAQWEWDPELLALRAAVERVLAGALRRDVVVPDSAIAAMDGLAVDDVEARGASHVLSEDGTWEQFQEYFALRSIYQLKEADPHAWAIPRLHGFPKAALVAVEFDEYGAGHGNSIHQDLFACLMTAAGLSGDYLGCVESAPAVAMLAPNVMSYLGLHRAHRGAIMGHLAATEITSSPGARRLLRGLERLGAPPACQIFYREHVEADAVHEQVMRLDVVEALIEQEPDLEADVAFGIGCFKFVEDRIDDHLLGRWS
jgi:hypothetical protein